MCMFSIKHKCFLPTESPPVVSVVGVVSVANGTSATTLTIEWTIANGVGGVLTVAVDPVAPVAPYTPLASGTGNIEPAMSPQSLAAVLSVVWSILSLLCGIGIGLCLMFAYMKWRRSRNETGSSPTQTSFPAPLYDDIVMTPITNKIEPLLQQNVAYRHVRT